MTEHDGEGPGADAAALAQLAALAPLDYDRHRRAEAERLGIRLATLDDQVRASQKAALPPIDGRDPAVEYSDDAVALEFAHAQEGKLLFVAALGGWLRFDGQRWTRDDTQRVMEVVRVLCRKTANAALQDAPGDADRIATSLTSANRIAGIEKLARCDHRLTETSDAFDRDPWALNTPDGVVDLRTGAMRPCRPGDLFTKVTAASPGGSCRKWLRFLLQITHGDRAFVRYLQRLAGYTLTGCVQEHVFMFLWGPGGNGKSVLLSTLASLLGDYAATAMSDVFTAARNDQHPTHVASLRGARMVMVSEIEQGKAWAEARLKSLTGGDRVSTRVMRGDPFEYSPTMKLWIAGNHRPELRNPGPAMRRRLCLLPLTYVPPRPDQGLMEALKQEWPGIFAWAISGCREWQQNGLNPPRVVEDATAEYFREQDTIATWVAERCQIDAVINLDSRAAYTDWKRWVTARGEEPGSEKAFSAELENHFAKKRTNKGRVFLGVRLLPTDTGVW